MFLNDKPHASVGIPALFKVRLSDYCPSMAIKHPRSRRSDISRSALHLHDLILDLMINKAPSAAVRAPELPSVQYVFDLVEAQTFMSNRPRHVGISRKNVACVVILKSEEQL